MKIESTKVTRILHVDEDRFVFEIMLHESPMVCVSRGSHRPATGDRIDIDGFVYLHPAYQQNQLRVRWWGPSENEAGILPGNHIPTDSISQD